MIGFFKKHYWLIIIVTLFFSLGQTLFMTPWQDDNALFFKLAHIKEPAGFLGSGIFGERAYKYTAFFYYPIYLLFGHKEFFYFAFGFLIYALTTYVVYRLITAILNREAGMLGGFLYACGFIGSDSFIRLFNSAVTSLSIILVSVFVWCYWKFFKEKRIGWYILSIFIFFLAAEFARARTHYLIIVPILFEIFFFFSWRVPLKKFSKSIMPSLFRIIPFTPIFFRYVILEDYRSGNVVNFVTTFFKGGYYQVFGFLSSLSSLVLPGWFTGIIGRDSGLAASFDFFSNAPFYSLLTLAAVFMTCIWFFIKNRSLRLHVSLFFLLTLVWKVLSEVFFINPALVATESQIFTAFLGGELLLFSLFGIFLIGKKDRPLYLFLLMSIFASLVSYSFYNPLQAYEKINRYLSHSFFFLVIFLSFIFYLSRKLARRALLITGLLIIGWGMNNLVESFFYQRSINLARTIPVRSFYVQLKSFMPQVSKGDVLYFDVADNARANFADAFSVAQMPDSTAIAWRYGVDRYDFEMFEDTQGFMSFLDYSGQDNKSFHSFYYSDGVLTDTTEKLLSGFKNVGILTDVYNKNIESQMRIVATKENTWISKSETQIENLEISSILPTKLLVGIEGTPISISNLPFPIRYGKGNIDENIAKDEKLVDQIFSYGRFEESFRKSKIAASSFWQSRVPSNLTDKDAGTVWQADRLLWLKDSQYLTIEVDEKEIFNRLAFINSYSDHTPLEFEILTSNDNVNWTAVKTIRNNSRYESGELITLDFEPQKAKFFRILFNKTLNGDSPVVSDIWLVPERYEDIDIQRAEKFLDNPFAFIVNERAYMQLLKKSAYTGELELSWVNNKNFGWRSSPGSTVRIIFDGKPRTYAINLPAGGTNIDKLKFSVKNFPGKIKIYSIASTRSI